MVESTPTVAQGNENPSAPVGMPGGAWRRKSTLRLVRVTTVANACLSLSFGLQLGVGSRGQQVHIRTYNVAGVPKRDLVKAQAEVTRIFAEARMPMDWVEGSLGDRIPQVTDFSPSNEMPAGCKASRQAREVIRAALNIFGHLDGREPK